ncbi:MAG: hypothetical protein JNK49_01000 [Planctomycetes bacterium]|nr:hypothetical protein [Planctomycetota bacterium]
MSCPPRLGPPAARSFPALLASAALLWACSGAGDTASNSGGGNPGGGGGSGGSGGSGNPLAVVLEFRVANETEVERTETVRASVPFPRAGYQSLDNLVVSGFQTAWLPLQRWDDGSVKIAQAQFVDTLPANTTKTYRIARDEPAQTGAFTRNAWVSQAGANLQVGAEVRDTFSVTYRALASGAGTVLQETPFVQVRRHRTYHTTSSGGIGRDYLSSTFYTTEFRDMPFVVVDWVLGNDYLGADSIPPNNTDPNLRPLGCVDVRMARFLCKGVQGVQAYRPTEEGIGQATSIGDGFTALQVMQDTFLDDAQTRRYRFLLRCEPPNANAFDIARWRTVATAMLQRPLYPLATQATWRDTAAAGLLGGPIAGPADAWQRAEAEYASWAGASHFGTWGSHGEVLVTGTTGTPRNHPLSPELGHAIQAGHPRLVQKLEQMAWIQAARPYHLWGLTVGAEQGILLWDGVPIYPGSRDLSHESLGRRALYASGQYAAYRTLNQGRPRAHGWEHFDHEHWSNDLLFDYWTMSGDAWAKEELRQLGESLKALMRLRQYATAGLQPTRAEGWCMQGFAQIYQATQDPALKDYAMRRVNEIIEVQRNKNHASKAMAFQSNYAGTSYPMTHQFFMPWQHGSVLYGFLGAYKSFREPILLQIAEAVVDTVEYSWVTNYQDPQRGLVAQGLRYYTPVQHNGNAIAPNYWDNTPNIGVRWGDSPLGGAHTFLTGGLHHLAVLGSTASVRNRALQYGSVLLGTLSANGRWEKWNYCLPPQFGQ